MKSAKGLATCDRGLEAARDLIGDKWRALILWHCHPERRRFGQLGRLAVGIRQELLIRRLAWWSSADTLPNFALGFRDSTLTSKN